MTSEGVIMIIILCLVLLKLLLDKRFSFEFSQFKDGSFFKKQLDYILFFAIALTLSLLITKLLFVLLVLNALFWTVFYSISKSLGYRILPWITLTLYWLWVDATFVTFDKLPHTEIWYYLLFIWGFALLFLLVYESLGRLLRVISTLIIWPILILLIFVPSIFIVYQYSFRP